LKRIFEFKCQKCKEIFDEYTEYKQHTECPLCGGQADKIISAPRIDLEGITGAFPGAAWAWEKKHRLPTNRETE
jgi:putative FmdB family regulatory protein